MPGKKNRIADISLIVAPVLSLGFGLFVQLDPEHPEVTQTAAVALLMAFWWITEAVPLAVTALLPMVLFPALGIMDGKSVAPVYFNHIIFLFLGGFFVALAMERWNLHRRIALKVLLLFGTGPRNLLLGFMTASAFLSMWISNTATTMMIVPIVLAIIVKFEETMDAGTARKTSIGLLLGAAYGSTLGGIATPVGTPPNLVFLRIYEMQYPEAPEISFSGWMLYALPVAAVLLVLVWGLLSVFFLKGKLPGVRKETLREKYEELGPMSYEQKVVLGVFTALALLWLSRSDLQLGICTLPGWGSIFPDPSYLNDGSVAVALSMLLFMIPSRSERGKRIMDWGATKQLPWNIVLLFGGGFALAKGFEVSGLSQWLGDQLKAAGGLPVVLLIVIVSTLVIFLTELTSNTATAQILLPVMAGMAMSLRLHPLLLMLPATLSSSLAFMLPVATPPNAIVFGSGRLRVSDMAMTGFILNLIGVIVITLATWFLGCPLFDIHLTQIPDWM